MTRPPLALTIVAAGFTLLVAAGCETPPPDIGPAPGIADPYPAPLNDPQITVLSEQIRPWLGFHPAIVTEGGNGTMDVQLPVRNLSERQLLVDYRILFFDEYGRELEPPMGWKMIPIGPKQTVRMSANHLDSSAENYRVEVKWAALITPVRGGSRPL